MTGNFVLYVFVGRLLIWIGQTFVDDNRGGGFIRRLFSCDLCLGVWVYTILAFFWNVQILSDVFPYVPILSELVLGCATSFAMHLLRLGWQAKFDVVVV